MDIHSLGKGPPSGSSISERSTTLPNTAVAKTQNAATAQTSIEVTQAAQVPSAPSAAEVRKAVNEINKTIQTISQNLEFSVDTDANEVIVKVIDQQTKQVLRQIPTVEALEIAKSLDKLQGLLIRQQA